MIQVNVEIFLFCQNLKLDRDKVKKIFLGENKFSQLDQKRDFSDISLSTLFVILSIIQEIDLRPKFSKQKI